MNGCYYNKDLEEDIKILEELKSKRINISGSMYTVRWFELNKQEKQAIENLINRNKELEVITNGIKVLETNGVNDDTFYVIAKTDFLKGSYKHLLDDYIPKSKVKEKIEEYTNSILENLDEDRRLCDIELVDNFEALKKELLEE